MARPQNCTELGSYMPDLTANLSRLWNESEWIEYACRYGSYLGFKDLCRSIESHLLLVWGALGFLGALCMTLTLSQSHFRPSPDFLFFRLVAYLEMLQMTVMAPMAASAFCNCEESYTCAFIWAHVATTIMNICADTVDLIVLFLCIERTMACLLPQYFRLIQTKRVRHSVIYCSFALPTAFSLFQSFEVTVTYDQKAKRFVDEPSNFAYTPLYAFLVYANMVRFYVTATLIAAATLSSIFGFVKAARRKERLMRRPQNTTTTIVYNPTSNMEAELPVIHADPHSAPRNLNAAYLTSPNATGGDLDLNSPSSPNAPAHRLSDFSLWRRNTQVPNMEESDKMVQTGNPADTRRLKNERRQRELDLCCLQLCLAAPIVINQVLYASGLNSNYSFTVGKSVVEYGLSYDVALGEIEKAKSFHILRTSTNISNVLAHALHFYLYLLFSVKVRRDFVSLLRRWSTCLTSRS